MNIADCFLICKIGLIIIAMQCVELVNVFWNPRILEVY